MTSFFDHFSSAYGISTIYFILTALFTLFYVIIALFQFCITDINSNKKLWYRFLGLIWCIYAFIINGLQIYSYHNNSLTVMIWLRITQGIGVIICGIATYNWIMSVINSVYSLNQHTKYGINKNRLPKWFKEFWNILLLFNIVTLFILYGAAFSQENAIFFDIHWLFLGFTFWIGSISIFIATIKITRFLRQTLDKIRAMSGDNNNNNGNGFIFNSHSLDNSLLINVTSNDNKSQRSRTMSNESDLKQQAMNKISFDKIRRLKIFRMRLMFIIICGFGTMMSITIYTIKILRHIIKSKYHHSIREQPYPNTFFYINMASFLILFDLLLLAWIFTMRCGCKNTGNQLFCKLFCCHYCFNLNKREIIESRNSRTASEVSSDIISSDKSTHCESTAMLGHKVSDFTV